MKPVESNETIVKEIVINASAERVFDAIAEPSQRVAWWRSEGKFETTYMDSDLRPGGAWSMRGTGMGKPFATNGVYRVVERPNVLEFTWKPDWPEPESIVRFDLEEKAGATTVRLTHSQLTSETRDRYQGWPWLLVLLQSYVQGNCSN